eukprot:41150-Eustigmatos_ZCMA.PRE.1
MLTLQWHRNRGLPEGVNIGGYEVLCIGAGAFVAYPLMEVHSPLASEPASKAQSDLPRVRLLYMV